MRHIFETKLPKNKSIFFSLQNILGIGKYRSKIICKKLGFSENLKTTSLTGEQFFKLIKKIEEIGFVVSANLKKKRALKASKQLSIKSFKSLRKLQGLPVRGQRTHTNAKTARKRSIYS